MTRPRIKRRRQRERGARKPDTDKLGSRVRRNPGVCRGGCGHQGELSAQGFCLLCTVRMARGGLPWRNRPLTPDH